MTLPATKFYQKNIISDLKTVLVFNCDLLKKLTSSDNVGGDIKTGLAEVVAVEMSRSNLKDSRTVVS